MQMILVKVYSVISAFKLTKMSNGFPEKILEYKKNGGVTQWRTLDPRQVLRLELSHCLLGEMIATILSIDVEKITCHGDFQSA